jgi:hypothetical protein
MGIVTALNVELVIAKALSSKVTVQPAERLEDMGQVWTKTSPKLMTLITRE